MNSPIAFSLVGLLFIHKLNFFYSQDALIQFIVISFSQASNLGMGGSYEKFFSHEQNCKLPRSLLQTRH